MFLDMLRAACKEIEKGDDKFHCIKEFFGLKCRESDVQWCIDYFDLNELLLNTEKAAIEERLEREKRESERKEKERREKEEREEKRRVAREKGIIEFNREKKV